MTTHRPQLTLILVAVMLTAAATCPAQDGGSGAIIIHLFYSPTCAHCHEVRALVGHIAEGHPGVSAVEHTLADPANIELMAQFYLQYGVPEEQWGGTVAVFAGERWWSDAHAILAELDGAVGAMSPEDAAGGVPNVPSPAGGPDDLSGWTTEIAATIHECVEKDAQNQWQQRITRDDGVNQYHAIKSPYE